MVVMVRQADKEVMAEQLRNAVRMVVMIAEKLLFQQEQVVPVELEEVQEAEFYFLPKEMHPLQEHYL
ncbi:hypothetical protein D3C71_543220 [compost metagenome]